MLAIRDSQFIFVRLRCLLPVDLIPTVKGFTSCADRMSTKCHNNEESSPRHSRSCSRRIWIIPGRLYALCTVNESLVICYHLQSIVLQLTTLLQYALLLLTHILASDPGRLIAEVLDTATPNAWLVSHPCLVLGNSRSPPDPCLVARTGTSDAACDFSVIDLRRANTVRSRYCCR